MITWTLRHPLHQDSKIGEPPPPWLAELWSFRGRVLYAEGLRPTFQISIDQFLDRSDGDCDAFHVLAHASDRLIGCLLVCDLGKEMNVRDWRSYLFRENLRRRGLFKTLHLFWKGRPVATQNRRIKQQQRQGKYWMHSMDELQGALSDAGFVTIASSEEYRGYSQLVYCRKPSDAVYTVPFDGEARKL